LDKSFSSQAFPGFRHQPEARNLHKSENHQVEVKRDQPREDLGHCEHQRDQTEEDLIIEEEIAD
jgi:hypothetical protein